MGRTYQNTEQGERPTRRMTSRGRLHSDVLDMTYHVEGPTLVQSHPGTQEAVDSSPRSSTIVRHIAPKSFRCINSKIVLFQFEEEMNAEKQITQGCTEALTARNPDAGSNLSPENPFCLPVPLNQSIREHTGKDLHRNEILH